MQTQPGQLGFKFGQWKKNNSIRRR